MSIVSIKYAGASISFQVSIQPSKYNHQLDMAHTSINYEHQAVNWPPLLKWKSWVDEFGFFYVEMELIFMYILYLWKIQWQTKLLHKPIYENLELSWFRTGLYTVQARPPPSCAHNTLSNILWIPFVFWHVFFNASNVMLLSSAGLCFDQTNLMSWV